MTIIGYIDENEIVRAFQDMGVHIDRSEAHQIVKQ